MKIKTTVLIAISLLLTCSYIYAQTGIDNQELNKTFLGASVQLYPAGIIATLNAEHFISENSSWLFRLGGNFIDRKDYSKENDKETGNGFGGSVGYRKHFTIKKGKIFASINIDVWNLWIDWKNNITQPNANSGTTYTLVVQPWIEAGYMFGLRKSLSQVGISAGFGREINTITNGKDVEQGWIASLVISYQFAL